MTPFKCTCGCTLRVHSTFCHRCGRDLGPIALKNPPLPAPIKTIAWVTAVLAAIFVYSLAVLWVGGGK